MSNKRCCIEELILLQLSDLAQRHGWLSLEFLPVRPIHDRAELRPAQVHNQLERRVQLCLGCIRVKLDLAYAKAFVPPELGNGFLQGFSVVASQGHPGLDVAGRIFHRN